jgi:leader peptidase (prepilin peptidase)/N-methyltransferase
MNYFMIIIVFLYGITIGSFLNVCIFRIPEKESFVTSRSHCRNCSYQLKWYDLIPLFSFIILRGRCRSCRKKISIQYPVIEALNGILYAVIFTVNSISLKSVIYCFLVSALIVLSVIDLRTYEIPFGINLFIGFLAVTRIILDLKHLPMYLIGFCCVSGLLLLIYITTKGRGIGGGDIKLMAVCGLLLGYRQIILAFVLSCILASVIHLIRMKISRADHLFAFGPYLSMGIFISLLYGNDIINWYLKGF